MQSSGEGPCRQVQPRIRQVLQQTMGGLTVQKLGEQKLHPNRNTVLAPGDQPCRRWCSDNAWHPLALAEFSIAPPADHAPVRFHLDLKHFTIFGTRTLGEVQSTGRALRRVGPDGFNVRGQVCLHRTPMTGGARLLTSQPGRLQSRRLAYVRGMLGFTTKDALAQIPNLGLRSLQVAA